MNRNFIKYVVFILTLISSTFTHSQKNNLYTPVNVLQAYKNNTRSWDGKPGGQYWQNYSDYTINTKVDPTTKILSGSETIIYHNESTDTLYKIVIRLYQDILHAGNSRDFSVSESALIERVKIKSLFINDENVIDFPGMIQRSATNLTVYLTENLLPDTILKVFVEWSFEIPSVRKIRMGAYSESAIFAAYWYPQISVYDDIDGWDTKEYYGRAEFYNDFNNYKFNIEAPKGFVVWATGELQNSSDVFYPAIIERIKTAKQADEVIKVIGEDDYEENKVTKNRDKNIWKFKAGNVTDITFAMSDNYIWDATSVVVDSTTGRRTLVSAVYPDSTKQFEEVAKLSKETIAYLSQELPGIPYPYPHVTTFCNGANSGGMESPMMANNGAPESKSHMVGLVFHEIAHNYFPFYMGINERKYAWMEEGWAAFLPAEVVKRNVPEYDYMAARTDSYVFGAGTETDPPPMLPTFSIARSPEFRNATYNRPAVAYNLLRGYLGKEKFRTAMQKYISIWNRKHPIPNDFFFTFNEAARDNLSWFWKPWFFESGYPDLEIKTVEENGSNKKIVIKKNGKLPVPVLLKVTFDDNTVKELYEKMSVWRSGDDEFIIIFNSHQKIKIVELGSRLIPDVYKENNKMEF
jgi:peptidase M1-like protein